VLVCDIKDLSPSKWFSMWKLECTLETICDVSIQTFTLMLILNFLHKPTEFESVIVTMFSFETVRRRALFYCNIIFRPNVF
jgi:hypothetical protein